MGWNGWIDLIGFRARKSSRRARGGVVDDATDDAIARAWARFGWREISVVVARGRSRSFAVAVARERRMRPRRIVNDPTRAGAFSWVRFQI